MESNKESKVWVIYRLLNILNGKSYIGQSSRLRRRLEEHSNGWRWKISGKPSLISKAIQKYGFENFYIEILCECSSKEEANQKESLYIKEYSSLATENGYNIRGEDQNINTVSNDTKLKLSKIGQGIRHAKNKQVFESDFIGVIKSKSKWRACVRINRKIKTKSFNSEIEAAEAYDKMVLFIYGCDAALNFPNKINLYFSCDLDKFYSFFTTRAIAKKSYYKYVSQDIRNKSLWVAKPYIKKGIKLPKMRTPKFAEEIDAAKFADQINFYYDLGNSYNFPDSVEDYDKGQLSDMFNSFRFEKKSKYEGVSVDKDGKRWRAYFYINRKQFSVGTFSSEEEANNARQAAILNLDQI